MVDFKLDVKFKQDVEFTPDIPEIPWGVEDPTGIATTPPPKRTFEKRLKQVGEAIGKPGVKVVQKGMGAISWPFDRASALVGTIGRELLKERQRVYERHKAGEIMPVEQEAGELAKSIGKGLVPVGKSMISKKLHPEAVTIPQLVAEDIIPDSPNWAKIVIGLAADFAISPFIVGRVLKSVAKGAELTGIPQKVKASRLPEWQRMKLRARAKTSMRIEKAEELTKPLSGKTVKKIAQELSRKSGKKITPEAVKLRLVQIVRGSVTAEPGQTPMTAKQILRTVKKRKGLSPESITRIKSNVTTTKAAGMLQQTANPVMDELAVTAKELKKYNILSEKTYLTRLTKKEIVKLSKQKASLNKQLTRLKTAPHYVGTKEISKSFPGRAKKIRELTDKIDDINMKILHSYHPGADITITPSGRLDISGGATKYYPRMYLSKEAEKAERVFPVFSEKRIRAPYAKQRKDIPFEVRRKQMGEIVSHPGPVTRKHMIQAGADIELAKIYKQAAANPEWASKIWKPGLKRKPLPDDKAYGALRGMFVRPRMYDDVKELSRTKHVIEDLYDTGIGVWKTFKVVDSPKTQFRNKISNKILLDLSGMSYPEQAKYATRVLKEWKNNTKEYQNAKRYFARTTMKSEIFDDILRTTQKAKGGGSQLRMMLNATKRKIKDAHEIPAKIYQHEEVVGKMMKYFQQRDQGKSVIEAIEEANKWLFDYGDLTRWEKNIARRAMPFYTFPRKALPRVVEAMAQRPHTVAKYPLMVKMMTQYSLYKLDMTAKDYEDMYKYLPEYMKTGGYIPMPYRDDNGDLRFFDWTYILPWGEIAEVQNRGILESVVTNPLIQIVGDIQRNKKSFDGRPIWNETDTPNEQKWKQIEYVWRNLVPSLAYKGMDWDKLAEAATGKPSKYGKKRLLPETIANTIFGLRTQPIDLKRQKMYRMYEKQDAIKELSGKLSDITQRRNSGNITEEEYKKKREQYIQQMKDLFKK